MAPPSWNFEKRIADVDRAVKPLEYRGFRLQLLKDEVRRRRGLPSTALSLAATMRVIRKQSDASKERLYALLHAHKPKPRRKSRKDTKLFRWKRQRQWLAEARDLRGKFAPP